MEVRRLDDRTAEPSPRAVGRLVRRDGTGAPAAWRVPEETPLAVLVNGANFAVMMATPADFEDFAVGFAVTEGLAPDAGAIDGLRVAESRDGYVLNLRVPERLAAKAEERRRTLAGRAGCGVCGAQTIEAALPPPRRVRGAAPAVEALARALDAFPDAQPMRAVNRSTHAAAFCASDGTIRLVREDVGRHNALDKLAGALLRERTDAGDGFILMSSRISVELVQKACAIGAPCLAAVGAPTALALRLAASAGLTLAAAAPGGVMIFDGTELEGR